MSRRVVLVTGASGLVGTWLRRMAPDDVHVVALVHRTPIAEGDTVTADLRDPAAVAAAVDAVRPSVVIHAAMVIDEASIVGATANVAEAVAAVDAELVHVSTDAVFSGDGCALDEGEAPDPIWDYGRWKAQAERAALATSTPSTVVRLPLVVSLDPEDHAVERIHQGVRDGRPTAWFDDELRQPAMASDIAAGIWRIAARPAAERAGVWHLMGPETLSRYEIAMRVAAALGADPSIVEPEPTPPTAVRPRHLDLRSDRARAAIGWDPAPILS
ncbi:sugar nucleotide-binding protein [Aquihabitans sp. McL0605]|uniref:sugar nucleotide-binding protein n=1 Tax=Aquihabitans sp. McL0605 TaxID=3415671 RepID=UPI003CF8E11A